MSIELTTRAAEKIHHLLRRDDLPPGACLRIALTAGGCGSFRYHLDVTDAPADGDVTFHSHGVRIICDAKDHTRLDGTKIDYEQAPNASGFVFRNPNAQTQCDCGESFST